MSCGVGCRLSLDLVLLWLWCRPVTVVPIGPAAWEPPYAESAALKNKQTKKDGAGIQILLLWNAKQMLCPHRVVMEGWSWFRSLALKD